MYTPIFFDQYNKISIVWFRNPFDVYYEHLVSFFYVFRTNKRYWICESSPLIIFLWYSWQKRTKNRWILNFRAFLNLFEVMKKYFKAENPLQIMFSKLVCAFIEWQAFLFYSPKRNVLGQNILNPNKRWT